MIGGKHVEKPKQDFWDAGSLDEECEECRRGTHKHMDAMKEPWFKDSPRHQRIDAIDCKNPVGEGQCICHLYRKYIKETEYP